MVQHNYSRLNYYKKYLQYKVEQLSNRRAFFFQGAKQGVEDVLDLAQWIDPDEAIFDIGANVGQSAIRFRAAFPTARIISFEPVAATYAKLEKNTERLNIELYKLALGAQAGTQTMFLTPLSLTSSLVRPPKDELRGTEQVEVKTLDQFVEEKKIGRIGLLKIDAEGFDLEVIHGGTRTLASGAVRFVMVECGFHPDDDRHPLFDEVRNTLMTFEYRVFGIYEQRLEWSGEPALRFANAVFCRQAATES